MHVTCIRVRARKHTKIMHYIKRSYKNLPRDHLDGNALNDITRMKEKSEKERKKKLSFWFDIPFLDKIYVNAFMCVCVCVIPTEFELILFFVSFFRKMVNKTAISLSRKIHKFIAHHHFHSFRINDVKKWKKYSVSALVIWVFRFFLHMTYAAHS